MTNELIERIFAGFKVAGVKVPVSFLSYDGSANDYIIYQMVDTGNVFAADDEIVNWTEYFDFGFYSKRNYEPIIEAAKVLLEANGFIWQPSRDSEDQHDKETGFFYKIICFAYERSK